APGSRRRPTARAAMRRARCAGCRRAAAPSATGRSGRARRQSRPPDAPCGVPWPRMSDLRELDRRGRMALILERDGHDCVSCRRPLDVRLVGATTEHVVPRLKGGPSWLENEVAACRRGNADRGHRTPGEWIEECARRGWEPNRHAVVAVRDALLVAIAARGG